MTAPSRLTRRTHQGLREAPVGAWTAGTGWVYACPRDGIFLTALFARPERDDVEPLLALYEWEYRRTPPALAALVDSRALTSVDAGAFEAMAGYLERGARHLDARPARVGVLFGAGLAGAVVSGLFPATTQLSQARAEREPEALLAWLAPHITAEDLELLGELVRATEGQGELQQALAAVLVEHRFDLDVASAAKALGMSPRTLQRRLSDEDTSFRDEVNRARIDEAKRRLRESEDPITRIALDLGYSSAQHFSRSFKASEGISPSTYRTST